MFTLDTTDPHAIAFALRGRDEGAVPEIHDDGGTIGALRAAEGGSSRDYIAFSHTAGIDPQASTDVYPSVLAGHDRMPAVYQQHGGNVGEIGTLRAGNGHNGAVPFMNHAAGVRRLTPRECERLMGWPDDHTRYRGTPPVEQADSHRYKQCGNGMAAPVVTWIASRILATEGANTMPEPATHRVTLVLDDGWLAELEKWRTIAEADETFVIESIERAS
jgi:DNA (cytosine-5)-methyltransferase 1